MNILVVLKWLAGIAAAVIGSLAIAWLTPKLVRPAAPPRIPALEGTWQFVRFQGPAPESGPAIVRMTAISFHRDGTYSATGTVTMPNFDMLGSGAASSNTFESTAAGSYTPIDGKTIKLELKGDKPQTQVWEYAISGNELTLTSPGSYTAVFRRA